MKCPRCGFENPPNTHLCEKCRYPLLVPALGIIEEKKRTVPPEVTKGMNRLRLFSSYYVLAFLIFQASLSILSISESLAEVAAVASGLLMIFSLRNLYDAVTLLLRNYKATLNKAGIFMSMGSTFIVGGGGYLLLPYIREGQTIDLLTDREVISGSILLIIGMLTFLIGNIMGVVLTQISLSREYGTQFKRAGQLFLISFLLGVITFALPIMELVSFLVLLYASYLVTDASIKVGSPS